MSSGIIQILDFLSGNFCLQINSYQINIESCSGTQKEEEISAESRELAQHEVKKLLHSKSNKHAANVSEEDLGGVTSETLSVKKRQAQEDQFSTPQPQKKKKEGHRAPKTTKK